MVKPHTLLTVHTKTNSHSEKCSFPCLHFQNGLPRSTFQPDRTHFSWGILSNLLRNGLSQTRGLMPGYIHTTPFFFRPTVFFFKTSCWGTLRDYELAHKMCTWIIITSVRTCVHVVHQHVHVHTRVLYTCTHPRTLCTVHVWANLPSDSVHCVHIIELQYCTTATQRRLWEWRPRAIIFV